MNFYIKYLHNTYIIFDREGSCMSKLTKTIVEEYELPATGQKFKWDSETKGFGLRLTPGSKVFIAQGLVNGKDRRVKIGPFGAWTVDQARKRAKELLVDMANGIDPNQEKKVKKAMAISLDKLVMAYIKDKSLKESSIYDMNKHLNGIFISLKDQPISVITRDEVLRLFRKASKSSKAQANQAFRLLRSWMNYAMATCRPGGKAIISENPVQVLSDAKMWHTIKPRKSRITTEKIGLAWNFIRGEMANPSLNSVSKSLIDAAAFILLTGCRFGEAATLPWNQVNLDEGYWNLPDPKNRNPVIFPLSTQALEILEARPRMNDYVFSREKGKGRITDIRFTMKKISDHIDIKITAHDLRRTFRAIAGECGIELWKTKLLMNHKLNQDVTISAYTETSDLRYLRPEIQMIGNWIEKQAANTESSGNEDLMDILFPEFSA
jgi:integrase